MQQFLSQFIVLSAPSGAGKTTIAKKLTNRHPQTTISISATTRPRRPKEQDGKDYIFIDDSTFRKHVDNNNFLEYEEVHGDYYGTLRSNVENLIDQGKIVIFDIDVKGALSIKKIFPDAILIFIKAPSLEELRKRLVSRKSESDQAIQKRLKRIEFEYEQAKKFDHIVVNESLNHAVQMIEQLILG